jgi:pimeloyl-ACP methyl ester carboxylesterase
MTESAHTENRSQIGRRRRVFTRGRIVALVLIAAVVAGLAYLRFAPDDDSVSVPAGAKAGDLILERCEYRTEKGSYAADCGTLVVPENRHKADSRLIALPVTRIRARSANPGTAIFRLQGGPGITNTQFKEASRFAGDHDVVLVGYRGMDGSSVLDCPEVESALKRSTDLLGEKSFRERGNAYRACADRLRKDGVDLAGYSLPQRVDDLEAARKALGYGRIDLLSESLGTRIAMIYSWRYPRSINRSVMLGVNPPGHFVWDEQTTDEQIGRYAALCSKDDACRKRTDDLAASLRLAYDNIPDRWWFLPIKEGNVEAASFFGLMNATTDGAGPLAAPWTIDTMLSAGQGEGGGAWFLSLLAQVAFPSEQLWGDVAAAGRNDAARARRLYARPADPGSVIGRPGTDLIWAGGRLVDSWPANPDENEYAKVRDSNVETLLIGGELDFATPPQWAKRELLPHLTNGREVVLENIGHTDDFWTYQQEAGSRLINTFFDSGRVDRSMYRQTSVDFTPAISPGAIATIVLGVMLGLVALALVSLLWMLLRVRRRGAFGRKASATLRSLYPMLLGLGGWSLSVLIVVTALPGVALDDELLAALSIGFPIGLGIYLAWVNRDWSARTKVTGFAAAVAGALIGARLGFNATEGLVAVVTTIVGAVAGANLTVVALDIAWDWQVRDRFAETNAKETLEARTSTG